MLVDIWTDIVCPWCYIGITRFDRALERFDGDAEVRLHPFQLDPEAPVPGIPALERYEGKFGSEAPQMLARVVSEAAKDGIEMHFDRAITGNTFDAHRLIRYAAQFGKDRDLEMALYRAYFTDGFDITQHDVLAERAQGAGLDRNDALSYLNSDAGVEVVREELNGANDIGITGVPAFVLDRRYLIPGAVDSETFLRILQETRAA